MFWLARLATIVAFVLTLWTGTAVHAADAISCDTNIAFCSERDSGPDQSSSDRLPAQCHAGGCHGHHVAIASFDPTRSVAVSERSDQAFCAEAGIAGCGPGATLRPPIA